MKQSFTTTNDLRKTVKNTYNVFIIDVLDMEHNNVHISSLFVVSRVIKTNKFTKVVCETNEKIIFETVIGNEVRVLKAYKNKDLAEKEMRKI
jgi:hypothetical protein